MLKHRIKKIIRFEYWSFKFFYFPFIPLWLYYSIKTKCLAYFCMVNPGIRLGGFIDYSKNEITKQLPAHFIPKTIEINILDIPNTPSLPYPFIAKPDKGERGVLVEKINSLKNWEDYLSKATQNFLIQEYLTEPLEFGVFYIRYPKEKKGHILSVTGKDFLTFIGDGKMKLREFIHQNNRAYYRKDYLYQKFENQLDIILPKGEKMILEEIGNHNRGTIFYDASHLITDKLENSIDEISKYIKGFYYGRYDVKTASIEAFKKGEFKVIEINGANSEATHIYDPKYNLIAAYQEVYRHLKHQAKIAETLIKAGQPKPSFSELFKIIKNK